VKSQITSFPAEIGTDHLAIRSLEICHYTKLLGIYIYAQKEREKERENFRNKQGAGKWATFVF
jgi:hypothetical protein